MNFIVSILFAITPLTTWAADPTPEVVIDFELSPAGSFQAKTKQTSGYAYKKAGALGATTVQISMGALETGIKLRDTHLKQRLETAQHPFAKMSDIKQTGKGACTGLLEYRSFKKNVKFSCEEDGKDWMKAKLKLSIPDFQPVGELQYMGVGVEDDVVINVRVPVRNLP